jgi:hypothetical protein
MSELGLDLKKSEEARLIQLFQTKCDEMGGMDLAHFISLAIERSMISNKYGLDVFYSAFKAACPDEIDKQNRVKQNTLMDNNKFFYAMVLLSKILFFCEPVPFDAMFSNMLVDKLVTGVGIPHLSRLPRSDQHTIDAMAAIYSP